MFENVWRGGTGQEVCLRRTLGGGNCEGQIEPRFICIEDFETDQGMWKWEARMRDYLVEAVEDCFWHHLI